MNDTQLSLKVCIDGVTVFSIRAGPTIYLCVSCVVSARLLTVCTDLMEKGPRVTRMRTDTSASGTVIPNTNDAGISRLYCSWIFLLRRTLCQIILDSMKIISFLWIKVFLLCFILRDVSYKAVCVFSAVPSAAICTGCLTGSTAAGWQILCVSVWQLNSYWGSWTPVTRTQTWRESWHRYCCLAARRLLKEKCTSKSILSYIQLPTTGDVREISRPPHRLHGYSCCQVPEKY